MQRALTTFVIAGAIAWVISCTSFAQRGGGHVGGFGGGQMGGAPAGGPVGGFSGGPTGHSFNEGVAGPAGGVRGGNFPAPHTTFVPGPANSGVTRIAPARPSGAVTAPRYSGITPRYGGISSQRSPFGQLPTVRRSPFSPGGERGWTNQPVRNSGNYQWHSGDHNDDHNSAHNGDHPRNGDNDGDHNGRHHHDGDDDHDGHHQNGYYYGYGWSYYPWPYYGSYGYSPYYGGDSGDSAPAQTPDQYQYRQPYYDTEPAQDDTDRAAYQPDYAAPPEYPAPPEYSAAPAVAVYEPTVEIIYKDGHAEMIHNYALTPTTLLVIDNAAPGVSLQVPLELINLPATVQINRVAGLDFGLPARN